MKKRGRGKKKLRDIRQSGEGAGVVEEGSRGRGAAGPTDIGGPGAPF